MAVLSYGFGLLGGLLFLDGALLELGFAAALPWFAPPLAAVSGFLIGVVWYFDIRARERARKKRRKALVAMCLNLGVAVIAVGYIVLGMLQELI